MTPLMKLRPRVVRLGFSFDFNQGPSSDPFGVDKPEDSKPQSDFFAFDASAATNASGFSFDFQHS